MIVHCIENTLQRGVLVVGREYEVRAERDDCCILSSFDKGFSKTRFEIVSQPPNESSVPGRANRRPLLPALARQPVRHVRRRADDPRASVGVGLAAPD
jgi:hypothetical protein